MSIQAYQTQQDWDILGATPLQLVVALYRGGLQSVRQARSALAKGQIRERSRAITKTCEILHELTVSLDRKSGGEIASNLSRLYAYMHEQLMLANIQQSEAPLTEVERLLGILLNSWEQIAAAEQSATADCEPLQMTA